MARSKDKLIQVEIYGQRYSLRADEDTEPGYVEHVAAHVDRKMKEIAQSTPTVDSLKVAVMAAVNIADEYLRMRNQRKVVDEYIEQKTRVISGLLDEGLEAKR
jgi:cell division protein ZapA